jgi:tetratricopeptide (TPR) repeat protein
MSFMRFSIYFAICIYGFSHARAESPAEVEARQHFSAAQKLYEHARWADALAEYQASYKLSKYPAILYKVALCQDQLGQYAAALDSYKSYLEADPASDRRAGIEERMAKLKELLAPPPPPAPKQWPPESKPADNSAVAAPAVTVEKPAPRRTPVYKKWWLWTIVGVAAAGVALGVGLGVGLSSGGSSFNANLHPVGPGLQ